MTLLIPTPHELDQLPDLSTFLRPMDPQPKGKCVGPWHMSRDVWRNTQSWPGQRWTAPLAPVDEIAWGQDWMRAPGCCLQPASTMPIKLAQYTSVVVECRPVKVAALQQQKCRELGYEGNRICHLPDEEFLIDWQANYPSFPFATSWAWQSETQKGKPDAPDND